MIASDGAETTLWPHRPDAVDPSKWRAGEALVKAFNWHRNFGVVSTLLVLATWGCTNGKEETPSAKAPPATETQAMGESKDFQSTTARNGGIIAGKVTFKGDWKPPTIPVTKDQEVCGKSKLDPSLIVSKGGGVQNAVVYISDIKKDKKMEPRKVTLDQKGCEYHPHVLAFPAGSTVEIVNPDGILHNIHSYSEKNESFNIAQPKFKRTLTVTIDKPEIISLKCDVHGWMSGWFFVSVNPYFSVSEKAGGFKLADVPPGEYTMEVWHEKLGKQSKKIEVKPDETVEVNFEFSSAVS